jgi:hypothetical protein
VNGWTAKHSEVNNGMKPLLNPETATCEILEMYREEEGELPDVDRSTRDKALWTIAKGMHKLLPGVRHC